MSFNKPGRITHWCDSHI